MRMTAMTATIAMNVIDAVSVPVIAMTATMTRRRSVRAADVRNPVHP